MTSNHRVVVVAASNQRGLATRLKVLSAAEGEEIHAGWIYTAPVGFGPVFKAAGVLGFIAHEPDSPTDPLFESAARFHGRAVVGVVLSGLGDDGTRGLRAITEVGGTRIVQSPSEATFFEMPSNALLGDSVEYAVMLDRRGELLEELVGSSSPGVQPSTPTGDGPRS